MATKFTGTCDECGKQGEVIARVLGWAPYCRPCYDEIFYAPITITR